MKGVGNYLTLHEAVAKEIMIEFNSVYSRWYMCSTCGTYHLICKDRISHWHLCIIIIIIIICQNVLEDNQCFLCCSGQIRKFLLPKDATPITYLMLSYKIFSLELWLSVPYGLPIKSRCFAVGTHPVIFDSLEKKDTRGRKKEYGATKHSWVWHEKWFKLRNWENLNKSVNHAESEFLHPHNWVKTLSVVTWMPQTINKTIILCSAKH